MAKAALETVTSFEALIDYLRDELEWPLPENANIDNTTFTYTAAELGLKEDIVGGGVEFRQLRPMTTNQPWGIFFLNLPHKDLPQTLVRNILGKLTIKKRASANDPMRPAFAAHDLLFITSTGSAEERRLAFAHFQDDPAGGNAASLKVLGWEADDTPRRSELTQRTVEEKLAWPDDDTNADAWRAQWGGAFTDRPREAVRTSKELAKTLAALARRIRDRARELITAQNDSGSLVKLHKAFKDALIHDLTPDAFADTYAQTITYGLLSTAMSRASGALTQDDMLLSVATTSPFLREMLKTFIEAGGRKPGADGEGLDFDELGVGEVVDFLRDPRLNMTAVLADFDQKNSDKDPVIHLYELFIHEYDKEQKFQRGVFYTPRQVVGFIVRSVDEVLRTELGLEDGLASTDTWGDVLAAQAAKGNAVTLPEGVKSTDAFVRILDPATGTGTFLVETVDLIHQTMRTKWQQLGKSEKDIAVLWNSYVPEHLLPRLFGFELMMAPYAIAHMKLGLKLWDTGYRFGSDARLRVHLTNALEPARDFATEFTFIGDAMANEAQDANAAKKTHFTAVIGNPPYAGHSSNNNIKWIVEKVHDYKKDWPELLKPGQGKWLQDDYVKFMRLSEFFLSRSNIGALGFITNNGWLDNPTFKGMRKNYIDCFNKLTILDLHGSLKKGKTATGETDDNVFDGVAQGVSIAVGLHFLTMPKRTVSRADLFGVEAVKVNWLDTNVISNASVVVCNSLPPEYLFVHTDVSGHREYNNFPSVPQFFSRSGDPAPGVVTTHDEFAIAFTENELIEKIDQLLNAKNEEDARVIFRLCSQEQWNYNVAKHSLKSGLWKDDIDQISYRPFDKRVTSYNSQIAVHLRMRATSHMLNGGNVGLISTRQRSQEAGQWPNVFVADLPIESTAISNKTKEINYLFPLWLKPQGTETRTLPNIAPVFANRVAALTGLLYDDGSDAPAQAALAGVIAPKPEQVAMFGERRERGDGGVASFGPRDLFDWIYAVLHSLAYRTRYADYLKGGFARIPLPKDKALFQALIPLGTRLVALHLLDIKAVPDLADPKSVRLAGTGEARVTFKSSEFEKSAWDGGRMYIAADKSRWFETVPERVANFHIGGYRPARKWLKDRTASGGKRPSPGRVLSEADILHYRRMITAMDATIDLMAEIDKVIEAHGGWPDAFRGMVDDSKD